MISRYEIKFRISNEQKQRFLNEARHGLQPDPHGTDAAYLVNSIYYDSQDLDAYWEKVDGVGVRRKLRLRFYGNIRGVTDIENGPAFLELKRRLKDNVHKERVRLTRAGTRQLIEDSSWLASLRSLIDGPQPDAESMVETVGRLHANRRYEAVNVISYRREAWGGSVDHRLRVTFDQLVGVSEPDQYLLSGNAVNLPVMPPEGWILEVKFDREFPRWIRDIVADHQLVPHRFSKYATGLEFLNRVPERLQAERWALGVGPSISARDE